MWCRLIAHVREAMLLNTRHRLVPSLGDKYLNLDANGAVLNGRNRHATPGAHSRANLSVSRSVAQSRTGHFYRSVNEMPGTN